MTDLVLGEFLRVALSALFGLEFAPGDMALMMHYGKAGWGLASWLMKLTRKTRKPATTEASTQTTATVSDN